MIKKSHLLPILVCIFMLVLMSCSMGFEYDLGEFLSTDLGGHFKQAVTYTSYYEASLSGEEYQVKTLETFEPSGDWSRISTIYEGSGQNINGDSISGQGYLPWEEESGTYKYSKAFLNFEREYLSIKNYYDYIEEEGTGDYIRVYSSIPETGYVYTETSTTYFAEHNYGAAYKANFGKWRYTYEEDYGDGDKYRSETEISFWGDELRYRYSYYDSNIKRPLDGNLAWERERLIRMTEDIKSNTLFTGGSTRRIIGYIESERERDFWDDGVSDDWDDDPYGYVGQAYSTSFMHFGDFIAYTGSVTVYERGGLSK